VKAELPVRVRWEPILEEAVRGALGHALRRAAKRDDDYPRLTDAQRDELLDQLVNEFWVEFYERFEVDEPPGR